MGRLVGREPDKLQLTVSEHLSILDALQAGQYQEASELMLRHIQTSRDLALDILEHLQEPDAQAG